MAKIETNQESWKLVGGRLCLDFINTVGGRADSGAVLRDKLASYDDLLEWSRFAGIVKPAEVHQLTRRAASHRQNARAALTRAILLRESLYRVFQSTAEGRRPRTADLDILSRELRISRAHQRLTQASGAIVWTWDDANNALDRILWPVTLSAAEVLTSADLSRLRQCEGSECGWMFLDTSRNRSRHWCDMKDCGNRAKVRRFRKRQTRTPRQTPARK
jgi:predicted RNA-binding Zn ribbon-like protein